MENILAFLSSQTMFIFFFIIIGILFYISTTQEFKSNNPPLDKKHLLTRSATNPVISPRQHLMWEKEGAFNPAALKLGGKVHLLYRAVGGDGVSRIGYATSDDGLHFGQGETYPIFSFEKPRGLHTKEQRYDPIIYPSGGSFGGCEDPRLTHIEDTIYMTFNAFDGWDYIRIGLTMISEKDFLQKRWSAWSKPLLISPPGEIHKNWMIFPEKINGKFAVLHSISPKVEIEYRKSLTTIGTQDSYIKSPVGVRTKGNKDGWDNRVRGAGAPPLKTDKGWLVLYHANQDSEPHKYKLGVQLLDLHDPTKVLAKSILPILEPNEWYENDGKPGIVYACGAIIKENKEQGDSLYVYYGGGDKYVCAAHTHLDTLLEWLITHGTYQTKII